MITIDKANNEVFEEK